MCVPNDPAELADDDHVDVLHVVAGRIARKIGVERGEPLREALDLIAEPVVALGRIALAVVRVPVAEIDRDGAQAKIELHELRDVAKLRAEAPRGLDRDGLGAALYDQFLIRLRELVQTAVNETIEYWVKGLVDGGFRTSPNGLVPNMQKGKVPSQ